MLELDRVASFLVELGLIDATRIVEGDLTIRCVARRNRNFEVQLHEGSGWFIKQPGDPADGGHETLLREAEFHRLCRAERDAAPLISLVPRLVHSQMPDPILIFDLIADAINFGTLLESEHAEDIKVQAARALGTALGTVHRALERIATDGLGIDGLPSPPIPGGMLLHRPNVAQLARLSPAILEALRILQAPGGIGADLDRLGREWRPTTLIHGDIKFENTLMRIQYTGVKPECTRLWIVDWEMVQFGDPAWDLAGALQDFLVLWVSSMPLSDELTAEQMAAGARVRLAALRPAIRALWAGYRSGTGLQPEDAPQFLLHAIELSAARLIQSAFEAAEGAVQLPGRSVLLLQIAPTC